MNKQEFDEMNAHDKLFWARRTSQLAVAMARINGKDITAEDIKQIRESETGQFERIILAIQKILVDENVCEYVTNNDGEIIKSEGGVTALEIKGSELNYLQALTTIESLFAAAVSCVYQGIALHVDSDFMRHGLHQVMLDSLAQQWADMEVARSRHATQAPIADLLQALTNPQQ